MMCGYKNMHFWKTSVVFLVMHLIFVVKQQNQGTLEGHCCHPIFNSSLCVKITINLKWTITALLSMVTLVNQFIILQFVLCKGCSPRSRLGSSWWLSHIPAPCLLWGRGWMNGRKCSFTVFSHLLVCMANGIKNLVVLVSQDSLLYSAYLQVCRSWLWFENATVRRCDPTHLCFPSWAKMSNDTQRLFV